MKIDKGVGVFLILLSLVVYGTFLYLINPTLGNNLVRLIWVLSYALSLIGMISFVFHRDPNNYPIPKGKIICIVPTYNENAANLNSCIQSLLQQTLPIDHIYVVDDGSEAPVDLSEFGERVELIRLEESKGKRNAVAIALSVIGTQHAHSVREEDCLIEDPGVLLGPSNPIDDLQEQIGLIPLEENQGKRSAQASVLGAIDVKEYPFCLTVDSDSFLTPRALEYMAREMHNPHVKACTATVLASNYSENLLTKIQDFNYGIALSITRSSARAFGLLDTTAGACSLYRTEIVSYHLDDYLKHGERHPYGDDRRMALYSMMEGYGRFVPEAVVYTEVPDTFETLWNQRVRWAQGVWSALPYFVTNLGASRSIFPLQTAILTLAFPVVFALMIYFSIASSPVWMLLYVSFIFLTTYSRALFYTVSRFEILSMSEVFGTNRKLKHFHSFWHREILFRRLVDWIIISPLFVLFTHFVFVPVQYVALYRLFRQNKGWGTR
ncbi:MAG: glycosyltransferase family 2 protein [Coriobacteriia bacterium]|nr:glycosyltransferase family 2 protein [Coriobacteriia bacterium]